ncbi:MAG TPA: hypothetical protein PKA20_29240, partial [Burkholderiaceae bacterium]|nr:hypothetical protein [Burkholderiaceae bacterium]
MTFLLAALISFSGSAESNFSISAHSEVVSVEPSCSLTLNWPLPAGTLQLASEPARAAPTAQPGGAACRDGTPMMLTLRAGSQASLEQLPDKRWQIQVAESKAYAGCASSLGGGRPVFELRAGERDCSAGASGATYRSVPAQGDVAPQDFAHLLEGRVVIGAPVLDPGGWDAPASTVLREARVVARIKAAVTHQSISVLDENIETGTTIDTAPQPGPDAPSARGFVRPHKDGGLDVLVHVTARQVGVTPHAGERRDVSVSRWAQWIASPFLQALLLAFRVVVWAA